MAFRVLVSDPLAEDAVVAMREAGLSIDEKTDLSAEQLVETIPEYDAIVVRSATKVRKEAIDAAAKLKLIVRAGVGLDNIDVDYATDKGISVRNTPAASSNSVAELALGHIISSARHIGRGTASLKSGKWEKKQLKGVEIAGKTLGVIGIGRIGSLLAQKAAALDMHVLACDTCVAKSPVPGDVEMVSLEELLQLSDFISLHTPYDPAQGSVIGEKELAHVKHSVRIVNCARGGVIDEEALSKALADGRVAAAALDVYSDEPPQAGLPLLAHENLSLTPHIGAATVEAQGRVGEEAAQIVIEFAQTF